MATAFLLALGSEALWPPTQVELGPEKRLATDFLVPETLWPPTQIDLRPEKRFSHTRRLNNTRITELEPRIKERQVTVFLTTSEPKSKALFGPQLNLSWWPKRFSDLNSI